MRLTDAFLDELEKISAVPGAPAGPVNKFNPGLRAVLRTAERIGKQSQQQMPEKPPESLAKTTADQAMNMMTWTLPGALERRKQEREAKEALPREGIK